MNVFSQIQRKDHKKFFMVKENLVFILISQEDMKNLAKILMENLMKIM